jgi:apolipoprotein N-acyltransferase
VAVPTADPVAPDPGTGPPAAASVRRWWRPAVAARTAGAVAGGALLYLSFPPRTLWWLVLPAFALLGIVLYGRRARAGFGYGFLFGLGFLLPLLAWTGTFVGSLPWVALSAFEALFIGLAGAGIAAVSRPPRRALRAAATR